MNGTNPEGNTLKEGGFHTNPNAIVIVTHSPEETMEFGHHLARQIPAGCVVRLEGELGSGKTTLTKGMVAGLGAAREEEVTSPSFTLVHEYGAERKVRHADLYRVETSRELSTLGLEDAIDQGAILIVEWAEKLEGRIAAREIRIKMEWIDDSKRRIIVEGLNVSPEGLFPQSIVRDEDFR